MEERPVGSFILSVLGSTFIVVGTALGYVLAITTGSTPTSTLTSAFAAVAVSLGIITFVASTLLYSRPALHVTWGIVIIVLSAASVTSVLSGYGGLGLGIVGSVLGIVGGSLGVAWHPGMGMPGFGPRGTVYQACARCGRMAPYGFAFCPFCGAPAAPIGAPGTQVPPPR